MESKYQLFFQALRWLIQMFQKFLLKVLNSRFVNYFLAKSFDFLATIVLLIFKVDFLTIFLAKYWTPSFLLLSQSCFLATMSVHLVVKYHDLYFQLRFHLLLK